MIKVSQFPLKSCQLVCVGGSVGGGGGVFTFDPHSNFTVCLECYYLVPFHRVVLCLLRL